MLVLDTTTKTIKVIMSGAAATTNPDVVATWLDNNGTTITEGSTDSALNGAADVTVIAAPGASTRRVVKSIFIENRDTAAVTITVKYDNNGTQRNLAKVTLAVGDTWTTDGSYDTNGNLKQTATNISLTTQVTGVLPVANGGTNASSASITAFNNITGYTASGSTGTTSTNLVFSTSPTLTTPTIGAATATTVNKVTITTPASGSTLTIADGKTATVNNTLTLAGTDSTTMTFPSTSATIARTDAANTFTGVQTMTSPKVITQISDTNGNVLVNIGATASAVNYVKVTNAATGTAGPILAADGETNVDLKIAGKGTGLVHHTTGIYGDITADSDGATVTFNLATSNIHSVTLGGNRTLALSNAAVGECFILRLLQDGTGSRTVTWFTTIKWAGGSAPTLTTTANKADMLGFVVTSSGNYDGFVVGANI